MSVDSEVVVVEDTNVGVILGLGKLDVPLVDVARVSAVGVAEPSVRDLGQRTWHLKLLAFAFRHRVVVPVGVAFLVGFETSQEHIGSFPEVVVGIFSGGEPADQVSVNELLLFGQRLCDFDKGVFELVVHGLLCAGELTLDFGFVGGDKDVGLGVEAGESTPGVGSVEHDGVDVDHVLNVSGRVASNFRIDCRDSIKLTSELVDFLLGRLLGALQGRDILCERGRKHGADDCEFVHDCYKTEGKRERGGGGG